MLFKPPPRPPLSSRKKILFLFLFTFLFITISALLGEGLVRFLDLYRDGRTQPALYQRSALPELIFELKPLAQVYSHGAPVQVNSYGLRNPEFPIKKTPHTLRILCVGDSVTFGVGVSFEETFPAQLQKLFHAQGKTNIEVLNAGVCSYNSSQELAWLKHKGLALEPDIVIFQWCENDFNPAVDLSTPPPSPPPASPSAFPFKRFLQERSYLYQFLRIRYDQTLRHWNIRPPWIQEQKALTLENCQQYNQHLKTLQKELQNTKLLLLPFPVFQKYENTPPGESPYQKDLVDELKHLPLAPLMGGTLYHRYKLAWDSHPSAKGHRLVAEALFKKLQEEAWLSPP
jgi:lysophospholipase L1-like esterase